MKALAPLLLPVVMTVLPFRAFAQTPTQIPPSPTGARIACVSGQRVFSESAEGKAAIARLTARQNERARAIDEQNRALQTQERALEQNSSILSEPARVQRSQEVQKFRVDVQRLIEDAQAELSGMQRDAENAFAIKFKPALKKVVKDKGLQLVFNVDVGQIAWFDPALDITSDVLKQLDQK